MVVHTLEDDNATAGRNDLVPLHIEAVAIPHHFYFVLKQALGGFLERLLHLSNANSAEALVLAGITHQRLGKEVALA